MMKKKIKLLLSQSPSLLRHAQYINNAIFHRDRLMKRISFGNKNQDKTFFVVRPASEDGIQGLMSLFIQSMRWIDYARMHGYEPYVDFLHYKTQYYDGIHNAWDYYFKQELSYEDINESKNVILSGSTWNRTVDLTLFRDKVLSDKKYANYCHDLIWDNIKLSSPLEELLLQETKSLNIENCLGVYIRGTDYVSLKPTGEYVQPTIEAVIEKVHEFLEYHKDTNIFLVTEDGYYYDKMKEKFGDKLKVVSFDSFICNYDGKDYLSKSNVLDLDKKRRGMEYLAKILLLSKCKYLISSITMGSLAAYSFNGGKYEYEYIFNLGIYK